MLSCKHIMPHFFSDCSPQADFGKSTESLPHKAMLPIMNTLNN
uniref:Uncharacterized protein n=1 Tax=Anguilla anguilla TaxID=7936 RepID=A0A0E9SR31_ANGAN